MTQEELDALMSGEIDDIDTIEEEFLDEEDSLENFEIENSSKEKIVPLGYNEDTSHHWPLPATDENKMVHQLDDVTKESEEKATQIFDIIEGISSNLMDKESNIQNVIDILQSNIDLFTTLNKKFPDVKAFSENLQKNEAALDDANITIEMIQESGDAIMNVMDIMQYQDIHRQKIERVINVMRALSRYMNTLFEGKIDDEKRVSSAQHIVGDTHNDLASIDDIEALLEQFGK
jgi:hypothetical protein